LPARSPDKKTNAKEGAMKILVINAGSSSCKYQLLEMDTQSLLCSGLVERIGARAGCLTHRTYRDGREEKIVREHPFPTHEESMEEVIALLADPEAGVIKNKNEIAAIGHRVVHGGEKIAEPVLVTRRVKDIIRECFMFSPLHNPANLTGIEVTEKLFPGVPNVAVFDTEFGMGIPEEAYMYALPYSLYEELGIRRYGFHGTSHKYIAHRTAEYLGKAPGELCSVTMHLGNGSSMTCVKNGGCFDTSMGLTPLEGLVMGTRCGSIDPAIVPFVMEKKGLSASEVDALMNKQSGLLGLCGHTDMRDVHSRIEAGDKRADLAFNMLVRSVKKILGSYLVLLEGKTDAVVFTAGIGENDSLLRAAVCEGMEAFGIKLDRTENSARKPGARTISTPDSKIPVLIIPTNEELQIALATKDLLEQSA
jgi:acetate kinase